MDVERHIPRVAELGHIGIHCFDIDKQSDFYTRLLGLTVTDQDSTNCFLSSRPGTEHHELVLTAGRDRDSVRRYAIDANGNDIMCGRSDARA